MRWFLEIEIIIQQQPMKIVLEDSWHITKHRESTNSWQCSARPSKLFVMAAENLFPCRNTKPCGAPFKNKRIWLERIEKFVSPTYFSDVNLYSKYVHVFSIHFYSSCWARLWFRPISYFVLFVYFLLSRRLYKDKANAVYLGHISTGLERFAKYKEVVRQSFSPVKTGSSFGPA